MLRDRLISLIAVVVAVVCLTVSGAMLPSILNESEEYALRYTDVVVEGAPPIVALGTAIGALRGLIVDFLWVKVSLMKEKGLFYEVMADAEMITKLQPRFAMVWGFHGHNMAYNISVATHTEPERWEWVNAGIRLIRNQGLRYNPNDLYLHRELAFIFAHKLEGFSDDANLYYKHQFAREWHLLLGEPPLDQDQRIAWLKEMADAPETLAAAEEKVPEIRELLAALQAATPKELQDYKFALDQSFLASYVRWQAITQQSAAAKVFGVEDAVRKSDPYFAAFDKLARDPKFAKAWPVLLAHVRKRVLMDTYNMDPQLMYEYTRDLGPIDWRHGQAHALYWSRRGSQNGEGRVRDYDVYQILNNDSQQMQAMQDLARWGRVTYDPVTDEQPGRFPEPRWIDVIDKQFDHFYAKSYNVRGAGGERFITFLQNFLGSAVVEWYRAGEIERAKQLMRRLDSLFGSGARPPNPGKYNEENIDVFVKNETYEAWEGQPWAAPRDVSATLEYGFKMGVFGGEKGVEVLRNALRFANDVTEYFKNNEYYQSSTKFGTRRIADIIGDLEDSSEFAFLDLMTDPSTPWEQRQGIWTGIDRVEQEVTGRPPALRAMVYDRIMPVLAQQYVTSPYSQRFTIDQFFPPPPGLELGRKQLAQRKLDRDKQREAEIARDPLTRQ